MKKLFAIFVLLIPFLLNAQTTSVFDKVIDDDNIIVCGQPNELELRSLPEKGITLVFNVRTQEEMSDTTQVKFDEETLLKELGITYILVPISGTKFPYREEVVEKFAETVSKNNGKILLHCKGGGRAANVYGAYEIKYRGKNPCEIMEQFAVFDMWPLPIEKLSGVPLKLEKK
ncbi:MAG: sulfur transferase domain-containing protein [bacterium]